MTLTLVVLGLVLGVSGYGAFRWLVSTSDLNQRQLNRRLYEIERSNIYAEGDR